MACHLFRLKLYHLISVLDCQEFCHTLKQCCCANCLKQAVAVMKQLLCMVVEENGKRTPEWQQNRLSGLIVHILFLYKLLGNSYLFLLFLVEKTSSNNKKPINTMNKMILEISYRGCRMPRAIQSCLSSIGMCFSPKNFPIQVQ